MKKIAFFLLVIFTLSIVLLSCKPTENCAAYGEAKKFQIEQN